MGTGEGELVHFAMQRRAVDDMVMEAEIEDLWADLAAPLAQSRMIDRVKDFKSWAIDTRHAEAGEAGETAIEELVRHGKWIE